MDDIQRHTEALAESLALVCMEALKTHGVFLTYGGKSYERLFEVMRDLATPK